MLITNIILPTVYCLLFTYFTWKNFSWGLYLFFFLLPTYLIRFNIGPLPTTLLEVMLWIIIVIWFVKFNKNIIPKIKSLITDHWLLFIGVAFFILASTISIFISTDTRSALGEWKAFYIEPTLLFIILITNYQLLITKKENFVNNIIFALILSGFLTSLLAIYQHLTGWLVPYAFWQNQNTFRVTAWYGFPNAVGLFLAPLIPLILFLIIHEWNKIKQKNWLLLICYLLFAICYLMAIIYSKGTGPLIGLISGIGLLLLFYKKTRWITVVVGIIGILSLFSLSSLSGLKNEVLLRDRSGQIRLSIWNETWQFLKDNPISGAGLASYSEKIKSYHTTVNGEGIEIFHHPHNIFLTMWVNLGLLGLVSFTGILISLFLIPYSLFKKHIKMPNIRFFLIASLTTIIITGLVDSPYIKNDLSVLFWLLPALLIITDDQSKHSV
ncbi:MAG: O-antigen ligase family protein [Candidatus Magasanikiibacteriota bacterium]